MDGTRASLSASPQGAVEPAFPLPPRWREEPSRFLLYSHDGLGLGHVRRNLAIAGAITEVAPLASVLLATSAEEAEKLGIPPGVDVLKLPGIRKLGNERYAPRRLRVSSSNFAVVRAKLLAAAVESFRPSVLLADKHPLGPGGELRLALEVARTTGARTVLGLRDILDDAVAVAREWGGTGVFEQIAQYYDRVLVYGQADVFDPVREYGFPNPVANMTHFCGYVFRPGKRISLMDNGLEGLGPPPRTRPVVLATAGGGEDGFDLLGTFIEAVAERPWDAIVVSGPQCDPARAERLRGLAAEARVPFHRFVRGLSAVFGSLDALVCMGGYNTLIEAAASGVPTVCVPRVRPRREQLLRAREFARFGLLRLLEPHRLDAPHLADAIAWALEVQRAPGVGWPGASLNFDGAARAAHHVLDLSAHRDAPPGTALGMVAP
jgi:predicted glycosyltransferase